MNLVGEMGTGFRWSAVVCYGLYLHLIIQRILVLRYFFWRDSGEMSLVHSLSFCLCCMPEIMMFCIYSLKLFPSSMHPFGMSSNQWLLFAFSAWICCSWCCCTYSHLSPCSESFPDWWCRGAWKNRVEVLHCKCFDSSLSPSLALGFCFQLMHLCVRVSRVLRWSFY